MGCTISFETQSSHLENGDPYLYPDEIKYAKDLVHGRLQAPLGLSFPSVNRGSDGLDWFLLALKLQALLR